MSIVLAVVGLALTVAGALVLAWLDLTAARPTWDSLVSEWERRRRFAWVGFPLIALGTTLQIISYAVG